jgi:hypothetical protein
MAAKSLSETVLQQTLEQVRLAGGDVAKAARNAGVPYPTMRSRYDVARRRSSGAAVDEASGSRNASGLNKPGDRKWTEAGDGAVLDAIVSRPIKTLDDLMNVCDVDRRVWTVHRYEVTTWTTAMKLKEEGVDRPHREQNYRVWASFVRKMPRKLESAIDALEDRLKKFTTASRSHRPTSSKAMRAGSSREKFMLEFSPTDAHFGKWAHRCETGSDCNLADTERVFERAGDDMLERTKHLDIEKIIVPIGSDFFHFDNMTESTTRGTPQDVDGHWSEVFEVGTAAMIRLFEKLSQRAEVEGIYVPGNHDCMTSFFLTMVLQAHFRSIPNVKFDRSPSARKYRRYGVNLVGWAHGDEEKLQNLPTIMAGEADAMWAGARIREFHVGHWHKPKEMRYNEGNTHGFVRVRVLPSLSGTDSWHYRKGYVGATRAAEAFLFSPERGLRDIYTSSVLC